ncbi:MAG: Ig-like domain-containing protein, partial [Steroidobacteraceae bacterium]
AAAPALADNETVTFTSAGETAVVVPPGVTSVDVTAVGGSGGAGDAWVEGPEGSLAGGQGAQVSGTIAVTPGQTIYLEVGGDGASAWSASDDGDFSGGGGGASDVRTAPASAGLSPDTRLLVAGGGGGTGWGSSPGVLPGAGGDAGQAGGSGSCVTGGGAGTQAGGGAAGTVNSSSSSLASPGSLGNGGQGADYITFRYNPYEPEYPHGWDESAGGFNGGGSGGGFITTYYSYYGGGGGGGGYYGGGGGGGNTLNADGSNGCLLGGGGDGGGGGGGSNLVPAGGSATIPAAGTAPSITLSFTASAAPVVGLTALPAVTTAQPDGYQLAVTGACESALGDSPTVSVALYAGSSDSGTPASTGSAQCQSGAWSATVSTSGLANGQYTALATQSNQASMTNDSSPSTFTLDQTVPALSLSTPALSGSTTAWVKSTPTFAGTAGTAARDDSTVSVTFTPVAGGAAVQTLSAAVNSSTGAWSVTASPALADGDYVATVTQQDNLGNISTVTGQLEVKTTVPVLTGFGCLTLGTPGDATPFCDGSADTSNGDLPDVTVSLYAGATASGTPVATLHVSADVDNLGFFQVAFSAPLSDGTYTAQAVQDDKAGNM